MNCHVWEVDQILNGEKIKTAMLIKEKWIVNEIFFENYTEIPRVIFGNKTKIMS